MEGLDETGTGRKKKNRGYDIVVPNRENIFEDLRS